MGEEANRMSLFYAYPSPLVNAVSEAATKFVAEHPEIPVEHTTDCFGIMSTVCRVMIESPEYNSRFKDGGTLDFCQHVMVASVILYDHVHDVGAFSKKNKAIDMIKTIKAVSMQANPRKLLNALMFTT